jgi:uncharacterized protein YkwD
MFVKRSLFAVATLLAALAPESSASINDLAVFQADILQQINSYRANHGVPPLKLNAELNKYAEERANAVSQKGGVPSGHDGLKKGFGENTYFAYSQGTTMFSGKHAAETWYQEQKDYKGDDKSGAAAERFTQMIWKNTTDVGCSRVAKQESTYYSTYIVCVFSPPGNVAGLFSANVPPVSPTPPAKIPSRKKK